MLPYVRGNTFSCEVIDLGNPLEVVLSHPNPKPLAQTASCMVYALRRVGGLCEMRSVRNPGIPEDWLESRPKARTPGLTLEELARQARAAYLDAEAIRVQRGREEVRVYVRLPADERDSITDVEGYLLSTVSGAEVPVVIVASLNSGVLPTAIPPKNGQGVVMVTADVDPAVISGDEASSIAVNSILADLTPVHPDPTYTLEGEQHQREPLAELYRQFPIAQIMLIAATTLMGFTPPNPERAIQARLPIQFATLLDCGILFATAKLMIVLSSLSTVHLCLIASGGSSGVRIASRIQMQGGHG